jgi:hypothetical protein
VSSQIKTSAALFTILATAVLLLVLLLSGMAGVQATQAAPNAALYVNGGSGNDGSDCLSPGAACATIGAAIGKAASSDTIHIAAGTYLENELEISAQLTLIGDGPQSTIIDGQHNGRIFTIYVGSTLTDLTLQNGATITPSAVIFDTGGGALFNNGTTLLQNVVISNSTALGAGAGIFNNGDLTIENSTILSNTAAGFGGGIYNYTFGTLTMTTSLVKNNTGDANQGGGIYSLNDVTLDDVTIQGNQAVGFGGGIYLNSGKASLNGVTITANQSEAGAGMFASGGTITVTNSTVSGNIAGNNQSGIYVSGDPVTMALINSTIAYNTRTGTNATEFGGLIAGNKANVTLQNTIIAHNGGVSGNNCSISPNVTWTSNGNNLASDFSCDLNGSGDQPGTDPLLTSLGDYGGSTWTHALQPGSPAIDAGSNNGCPATDQRSVTRPYDGDNDNIATCDVGAVEAEHQLTIADVSILEGSTGLNNAVFTVTLSPQSDQIVTVNYTTVAGSAEAGSDYTTVAGALTFDPGDITQTITVPIETDTDDEPDEAFTVQLSNPSNAAILDGSAAGNIIDDDGLPALTIADETILEGNSGSQNLLFTVTLSPASTDTVTVNFATMDGTAVNTEDYTGVSGQLTFNPAQVTQTISVPILGDIIDEGSSEAFTMQLTNPVNAALVTDAGTGTITDNETALLSQGVGPQVLEGNSGTSPATFTVTLSVPAAFVVTVDYSISSGVTSDGAIHGDDFSGATSGTLTFQPGETAQTFSVDVIGDLLPEGDEVFSSLISNANVGILVNGGLGRIINDDGGLVFIPLVTSSP